MEKNNGQIEIRGPFGSVFLYTHNTAQDLMNVALQTLSKKVRWDDPDYLARMLFCNLIPLEFWKSDKGFGIGTQMYDDVKLLITIDTVLQKVIITNFEEDDTATRSLHFTFDGFVESFANNASL